MIAKQRSASVRVASALLAAVLCLIALPASAFAATEIADIKTVAQVQTDGALHVVEQRTYLFEEERSALIWPVTSMEADSKLEVASIRFAHSTVQGGIDGEWTSLEPVPFSSEMRDVLAATSGASGRMRSYEAAFDDRAAEGSSTSPIPEVPGFCMDARDRALYLFFPPTEGRVVFECDLTVTDAVRAFDDVAELYWDYVPADVHASAMSVSVSVQLPMPEGIEAVAGQNVHAWGHGAPGTVNVKADGTVMFRAPEVHEGQYAQAHVLFPQQWLTNLSIEAMRAHSGPRLDGARAEEEAWTDTWSAWLTNSLAVDVAFVVLGIMALVAAVALYFAFGREPKPQSESTADAKGKALGAAQVRAHDACKAYEAPLVGRLFRWDHASLDDFVALLMELADRGAITIEVVGGESPLGCGYEDLRFRSGTRAKDLVRSPIDQETFRLLFDVWGEGYASVTLSDIARHAQADPGRFRRELAGWTALLDREVRSAGFFDTKSARVQRAVMVVGCVLCLGAILFGVAGGSFVRGTALVASGIGCLVIGNYLGRRTPVGSGVEASVLELERTAQGLPSLDDMPAADAPYLFAVGFMSHESGALRVRSRAVGEADAPSFAAFWLGPRCGRGGKPALPLASQLSKKLDEWG